MYLAACLFLPLICLSLTFSITNSYPPIFTPSPPNLLFYNRLPPVIVFIHLFFIVYLPFCLSLNFSIIPHLLFFVVFHCNAKLRPRLKVFLASVCFNPSLLTHNNLCVQFYVPFLSSRDYLHLFYLFLHVGLLSISNRIHLSPYLPASDKYSYLSLSPSIQLCLSHWFPCLFISPVHIPSFLCLFFPS